MQTQTSIIQALRQIIPEGTEAPLHQPEFAGAEWPLVKDCLDSGWVSSVGRHVDGFERALADYTGIPHAVCTVNGTSALHACLLLAGVRPGDEVLTPALTFVGTCNPIRYCGAEPHFVDCSPNSLGLDPDRLTDHLTATAEIRAGLCRNRRSGRPIRALMAVHLLGHAPAMEALAEVAARYRLLLIEDAAEALGSWRQGRHAGAWGQSAALSFNGNKIVTSGGGGALLTADPDLAARARHLTTTAKRPHAFALEHDQVGYNYRMPNLNAALGLAQLRRLPDFLRRKRLLAERYRSVFDAVAGCRVFTATDGDDAGAGPNHWLNLLLLDDPAERDPLLQRCAEERIFARPFWTPMHQLPMYRDCPRMGLPVTEDLFSRGVCLPSSPALAGPATA